MAKYLEKRGLNVHNIDYPSRSKNIASLAEELAHGPLQGLVDAGEECHFVTHSMGGIVLRYIDQYFPECPIGNVVMLGPPNGGSELVEHLRSKWWARWWLGPAFLELSMSERSLPRSLGEPRFTSGVIAGNQNRSLCFNGVIPSPGDGKVSVESTKLEGMADHKIVESGHTFLMNRKEVQEATLHFIQQGWFQKSY
jgi:pimeloyl-ACP methyl ester carboxylesterase